MITLTRSLTSQNAAEQNWRAFNNDYLLERATQPGRVEARYALVDDALARLQVLIARERFRNPRVRWETGVVGHHLVVVVTGDADDVTDVGRVLC